MHVVAGCQSYLERFTWRHNSILNFLAQSLQFVNGYNLFADVPEFNSPSIISGVSSRFTFGILEQFSVICCRAHSNLCKNVRRKQEKYKELIKQPKKDFNDVKFVNISMSSQGVFANECVTFMKM